MGDRTDGLVCEMIGAAVLSGAYRALARELPEASGGLMKLAVKWSGRAATLANGICAEAMIEDQASAPMSGRGR